MREVRMKHLDEIRDDVAAGRAKQALKALWLAAALVLRPGVHSA